MDNDVFFEFIELEFIELVFICDEKLVFRVLNMLREYGFRLFLDDFGSGFLFFSYLWSF